MYVINYIIILNRFHHYKRITILNLKFASIFKVDKATVRRSEDTTYQALIPVIKTKVAGAG